MAYATIIWKSSKIIVHDIEEKIELDPFALSVKILTNVECFFFRKEELKEDKNEAKIGAE